MTFSAIKPIKTRTRLLHAAVKIFSEQGFQEATIAEICELAQTNIASVNYHFRDKENLYLEAWRHAFNNELKIHPPEGDVPSDAPAELRLAGRIKSLILRIADDNSYSFAIINKEMTQPTRLLSEILEKEIDPQRQKMLSLIRECLGQKAAETQILLCHASILGQCFHLLKMKHLQKHMQFPFQLPELTDAEAYAQHVIDFSLAGIRTIRQGQEEDQ